MNFYMYSKYIVLSFIKRGYKIFSKIWFYVNYDLYISEVIRVLIKFYNSGFNMYV